MSQDEAFTQQLAALKDATATLDLMRATDIGREMNSCLARGPVSEVLVERALKAFRNKRMFTTLQSVAESALRRTQPARVRLQYAQALVDQDQVTGASSVLVRLLRDDAIDDWTREEARGLLGRAHKQAFVRASLDSDEAGRALPHHATESLRLAVSAYDEAWRAAKCDPHWPAINLLGLLMRAKRDGISVAESSLDTDALAQQIIDEVNRDAPEGTPCNQPWKLAVALEASLVFGDDQQTIYWGKRYLDCEGADAFEFGSTLRQLTEVWRLHASARRVQAQLLALLEARLLQTRGGQLGRALGTRSLPNHAIEGANGLEAIWGKERFESHLWMRDALRCGDAVAQIEDRNGMSVGTGFLLRGNQLCREWGDDQVLLTNRHVVSATDKEAALRPFDARARFTTHGGSEEAQTYAVETVVWESPDAARKLDVSVLRLSRAMGTETHLPLGQLEELRLDAMPPERLFVIGHPAGMRMSYSLYDNDLTAMEDPYLYYKSPTLKGSSGSPLFDRAWKLVGVHHSAPEDRKANCGSSLDAIRRSIRNSREE